MPDGVPTDPTPRADATAAPARRLPVARNALWLLGAELTARAASLVFVIIVARALGVREYGWFTFATAFVPLFLILGSLGLHQAVVRSLVADRAPLSEVFASGLAVRLATAVVAVALSGVLAPLFLDDGPAVVTVVVVGVALALDATTSFLSCIFEAHGSVQAWAAALVINRVGSTVLALGAFLSGAGLPLVLLAYLIGSSAGLAYGLLALHRRFPAVTLRDARTRTARQLLRAGAPLGVASLLNMALLRFATIMIAALLGAVEVGLYGVAFRFYESFLFVAFAVGDAAFPRYAREGAAPSSARTVESSLTAATAAYVPLFVLSLFAAPYAVVLLFGERYVDAAAAVPWLTLAVVFFAVTYQARSAVLGLGDSASIVVVAALALVVNVALNLVLIPRHGITGAAVATAVASGLEAALTAVALRRLRLRVRVARALSAPVAAGTVTGGALVLLDLRDGAAVLVGGLVYAVVLAVAARMLPQEQRRWLLALVRRG